MKRYKKKLGLKGMLEKVEKTSPSKDTEITPTRNEEN